MTHVEVRPVRGHDLRDPLRLLEGWLRDGEPVPDPFAQGFRRHVEAGDLEVLAARLGERTVGVLVLAFRPSVSLGSVFASIEDLYVHPEMRRRGVGSALLRAADERCGERGVSYVEVQAEGEAAGVLYAACGYGLEGNVRVFSRSLAVRPEA